VFKDWTAARITGSHEVIFHACTIMTYLRMDVRRNKRRYEP
jgi:hypothetical protein